MNEAMETTSFLDDMKRPALTIAPIGMPTGLVDGEALPAKVRRMLPFVQVANAAASAAADAYGVTPDDIYGPRRYATLAAARHMAMFVTRHITGASYPEISKHFGRRDHGSAVHACVTIQAYMDVYPAIRAIVSSIQSKVVAAISKP